MKKESAEVDLKIPESGELLIPVEVLNRLNVGRGSNVHVRVTASTLSGHLKRRNVTEEEIEHIASLQLEPRENVVKFLATESVLSGDTGFKRRAQALRGRV